jgi:Ca-activated chloride channel homolog
MNSVWQRLHFLSPLPLLVASLPAQAPTPPPPADSGYKISTNVERVVLGVSVRDREGRFVAGLERNNFLVLEDGRPQQIRFFSNEDSPITLGLVIDNSGSMGPKRTETNAAALELVNLSNPSDEVFVIHFNENVSIGLPEGTAFASDHAKLRRALSDARPAGKTALYDAVAAGLQQLAQGTFERKALVLVSDGGDNSSRSTLKDVLNLASRSQAFIYTIGIYDEDDMDRNPDVLKKLARLSGGEVFLPSRLSEMNYIARSIAAELRNQYTIGYAPADTRQGGRYRSIRVVVNAPELGKLRVRARPGYLAPGPEPSAGDAGAHSR